MNRKLVLRLPPKKKILVYAQIVWVMIMLWLRDVVGLPSWITYFTDVLLVCMLVLQLNGIRSGLRRTPVKTQLSITAFIGVGILLGLVLNLVSPLLVVWAARNNFRFFAFFFICAGLLQKEDIEKIIGLLLRFFWINVLLCTYQYFVQGRYGDYLGGLFGVRRGSNTYLNVLLCFVVSHMSGQYFGGKTSIPMFCGYVVACVYVAFLAELKVFYLEVFLIISAAMMMKGASWKTALMLGLCGIGIVILGFLLSRYDAYTFMLLTDMDAFEFYLSGTGYTQSGDLNRFSAISQIYELFYQDTPLKSIFGHGFGSCEYSQFSFLQSAFSQKYEYLNYRWFTHAWVFLEQGAYGLIMLVAFFASILRFCVRIRTTVRNDMLITAFCFALTCIVGLIYNSALQLEACYLIAPVCAIPYIQSKKEQANTENSKEASE